MALDLGVTFPQGTNEKAKVTSNDKSAGYLKDKLVAGGGVTLTENNDGGNETLTINSTGATPEYGEIFVSTSSVITTISGINTFTLLNMTSVGANFSRFTNNGSGRLTYTGTDVGKNFYGLWHISGHQVAGSVLQFECKIYKNGSAINGTQSRNWFIAAGNDISFSGGGIFSADPSDYFEVWIKNVTTTDNWDTRHFNFSIYGLT